MYPDHTNCTCGEDQPNFNDRECREFYWNRRRRNSGRQYEDCIIEESSEHSSDDERDNEREKRYNRASTMSENFKKEKSVSRSSSGIGTASHNSRSNRKISSDDTSSRCFSPSLKNEIIDEISDTEKDLNDNYEEDDLSELPHGRSKRIKQLGDSKFGSLKSLKKALSKKNLFKNRKRESSNKAQEADNSWSPKTPVLGKYGGKTMGANEEDDFGSFTEEDETYSLSDFEEPDRENFEENYGRGSRMNKSRSKSYGNVSNSEDMYDVEVSKRSRRHKSGSDETRRRHNSGSDETRRRHNSGSDETRRRHNSGSQGKYLKQYKGDILSSSEESDTETEVMTRGGEVVKMRGRKYSSQMREFSDYEDSKEEIMTDKPAMNTLKKTFTAMLSRIGNRRMLGGTGDTSSDNISVNSRYSNALETRALADRPFNFRNSLSRANSVASVNMKNNGKIVTQDAGKKTFMYFSSDVGKGFIISDDEEVTGVISVMNMSRKKSKKIRDRITGTITDTLRRNTKGRKKSKATNNIPNFLFVNKPYFSSEESLNETNVCYNMNTLTNGTRTSRENTPSYSSQSPTSSRHNNRDDRDKSRDRNKQYRSELMLKIPSKHNINSDDETDYPTIARDTKKRSRSRHPSQSHSSHMNRDDYYDEHEMKKQDRQRRKKTS